MIETLDQALGRIWQNEWRHRRSGATLKSQAEIAVYTVKRLATGSSGLHPREYLEIKPSDVTQHHIQLATADWYGMGLSPATISKRLNCLSKLGVDVEGCRVSVPKQLKWHLKESDKPKVLAWLRDEWRQTLADVVADFIEWTTLTGLRIEESLALDRGHFSVDYSSVSVPGTKTGTSQATLPLGPAAQAIAERCHDRQAPGDIGWVKYMFFNFEGDRLSYDELLEVWTAVREAFGWQADPTATLKALRRSAARYLHVDCGMPLHMVQQYLRHESMDTTLEYLRLTGGYGTEEMRRYLK